MRLYLKSILIQLILIYEEVEEGPEDNIGRVPLHIAAENGHSLVCKQFEWDADHEYFAHTVIDQQDFKVSKCCTLVHSKKRGY